MGEDERSVTKVRIETATTRDVLGCVTEAADQRFYLDRLRRGPDRGRPFLAFVGTVAVGHVYLRLEDAEEEELREHLPKAPLLQRLRVFQPYRLRGYGRELVAAAETAALDADRGQIALGIDDDAPEPVGFYRRMGYEEWQHGLVETFKEEYEEGGWVRRPEFCRIFAKELRTG